MIPAIQVLDLFDMGEYRLAIKNKPVTANPRLIEAKAESMPILPKWWYLIQ